MGAIIPKQSKPQDVEHNAATHQQPESTGAIQQHHQSSGPPYKPVTKEELGRSAWTFLHSLASNYPPNPSPEIQEKTSRFMYLFADLYPCEPCAIGFQEILKESPPQTQTHDRFEDWMCHVHNQVNIQIGKPTFDCNQVRDRWGSCEACSSHKDELEAFTKLMKTHQMPKIPKMSQ
mmetsp:Transcript_15548/g.27323  ORF Transcript_15548/g.27323 Transcript_15548/m.27323 type:complete len:176 (+) Transcript_15548:38-565(+)